MSGLYYISYFFGGAFLTNALPHWISGLQGRAFQSPFAKPPGQGLSSSTVNVLWGFLNLVVAYVLLVQVGDFKIKACADMLSAAAGGLAISILSARLFGKLHGGNL